MSTLTNIEIQKATAERTAEIPFTCSNPITISNSSQSNGQQSSSSSRSTRSGNLDIACGRISLLVSIKQLLESLTQWSIQKVDEARVSDVYVRLGNDFNAAVAAFGAFDIDMSAGRLAQCPGACLAEDANPENLELYLPAVQQIITGLLQGLRNKQSTYQRIASSSDRQESRSSKSHRKQLSRSTVDSERDSTSRRSAAITLSQRRHTSSSQAADSEASFVGGFFTSIAETPSIQDLNDLPNPNDNRRPASSDYPTTGSPLPQPVSPPPPAPSVPANVNQYSLMDKLVSPHPSVIVVEPASPDPERNDNQQSQTSGFPPLPPPPPESPPLDALQAPAMASSLAALKKSDALERRASKRFPTYNISKMTGAVGRDCLVRNNSNMSPLAISSALTPGELAKELASRGDEMLGELMDFVEGKKLKMTGGAEEAERVCQKRNDMTLKAMFTGSSAVEISPMGGGNAILSGPDV
ncbi:hypothetical protein GGU11DRAFT_748136 [Lentinula aff. detonsa]|nr:hypothetical protein GGU11DRAFT_748136 [Lentinula aff. detonsa]